MEEVTLKAAALKELTSFVADAEPHLAKQASFDKAAGDIDGIVDSLIAAGALDSSIKEASIAAMKSDPAEVVRCLKSAAEFVALAQPSGEASTKEAGVIGGGVISADDAFVKALM